MITLISGTNREGSKSLKMTRVLEALYADLGETTHVLDLAELPPEALASTAYAAKPPAFAADFIEPVMQADGLHLVVPEYNGSFPGALKLFIDLLPFPEAFERRPAAYVGLSAGASGAVRPVEQLQQVFGYRNAFNFPERVFLPAVYQAFGEDGQLRDADLEKRLRRQILGFRDFVRAVGPLRPRPEV